MEELIETFLGGAADRMAALTAAVERDDVEGVTREAHTLKTNAATFGAVRLAELCRELEGSGEGRIARRGERPRHSDLGGARARYP